MITYRLFRIDTDEDDFLGFARAKAAGYALDQLECTIRSQQVGSIMELRCNEHEPVTLSNDISRYYVYPQANKKATAISGSEGNAESLSVA